MKPFVAILLAATISLPVRASTAFGDLNNFDAVNDTGQKCYGFLIELDDIHSTDISYTYDWNHYGPPTITEDNSDPAHPKVFVRYEGKRNPDGTFSAFTNPQDPANPIQASGHSCTDPTVNLGCEHYGVGYSRNPSRVVYNWLIEDPTRPGTLILGPVVNVATPTFVYYPPIPAPVPGDPPVAPAQLQVVIDPPEAPEALPDQFGVPVWVKVMKTVQKIGEHVKLDDLLSEDDRWAGEEPIETEIEWMVFQKRPASNPGVDEIEAFDDLPNGDETVTRRYEFYVYNGPTNPEDGEAQCSNPDDCPGAVGGYIGAQMAGFNVESPLGLIDNLQDGQVGTAYVDRTVVVGGNTPYTITLSGGGLPPGLLIDPTTGVLSGTPTAAGAFAFTLGATDADGAQVSKSYTLAVRLPLAVTTTALPDGQEGIPYALTLTAQGGTPPYAWSVGPLPAALTLGSVDVISGIPAAGSAGDHLVSITVTDALGNEASAELQFHIAAAPNTAPVAQAGPDQEFAAAPLDGLDVTLDGTGSSDLDGDGLTYTWTGTFGTAHGALALVHLTAGVHDITLTVADGRGGMASDHVVITISNTLTGNVTDRVKVTRSGFRLSRTTRRYVQTVSLVNTGTSAIAGPVSLILDNLSANATLFNPAGTTALTAPAGSPYLNAGVGPDNLFSPGETVTLTLEFANPTNQGITYETRIHAGDGNR